MNSKVFTFCLISSSMISLGLGSFQKPPIKYNADGSIGSNSGPPSFLDQWRSKRGYYYWYPRQYPTPPTKEISSGINAEDAQIIVDEHNKFRKMVSASNMQKVYWDPNLAASAQSWADQCYFGHSQNRVNTGESIWATPVVIDSIGRTAVKWWHDELYTCGCGNGYTPCCAHYSQMVWADTNRIGCGLAVCPYISNAPGQRYFLVCQYNPAGNRISQQAYCYGSSCSTCPFGTSCGDGLCGYPNARK